MCLEIGETNIFHDACILFGDVSQFNIMSESLASGSYSWGWPRVRTALTSCVTLSNEKLVDVDIQTCIQLWS